MAKYPDWMPNKKPYTAPPDPVVEEIPEEEQGAKIIFDNVAGVEFKNVKFGYDDTGNTVFRNFNFLTSV